MSKGIDKKIRKAPRWSEFYPPALEVQETPPSPVGRAIVGFIIVFFVIATTWAVFGRVDIVAIADGKVIPSGRVKTIQPLEIGVVSRIHVREGQAVEQGDLLITLDETSTDADRSRIALSLLEARLSMQREKAFLQYLDSGAMPTGSAGEMFGVSADFLVDGDIEEATPGRHQQLLAEKVATFVATVSALESDIARREAEMTGVVASVARLVKIQPLVEERAQALRQLLERNLVARVRYLEVEEQRITVEQDLVSQRAREREIQAAVSEAQAKLDSFYADSRRESLAVISEWEMEVVSLSRELAKADQRNRSKVLRAPIPGYVEQLAVHTIGGVVTPAQALMHIVPVQHEVEVEALLRNRDIGFIHAGQDVEVKIAAFNFTRYGTIAAKILSIASDAVEDEQHGLAYKARIALASKFIHVNGEDLKLSPGMAVTVEVKTGRRRVIEYFLSPLLRYGQESIRER